MYRKIHWKHLKRQPKCRQIPDCHPVRIPTLAEVLELIKGTDMEMTERIWCSSFNHESVCRVKALCPEMKCGFLRSRERCKHY